MTSGIFHSVEIASIIINRAERQRRELVKIGELADSIRRLGLIHPIVIRSNIHELVVGERRLEACRSLGWTHISAQYLEELDERALRAIELEENIKRIDLSWQDEARAVAAYHDLRKAETPDWTLEKTAEAIGLSVGSILDRVAVVKEISAGNTRVAEAPKLSIARGIVERKADRARSSEITAVKELDDIHDEIKPSIPHNIFNVDFISWTKFYKGPKFNFIHCDFPYGINADKFQQSSAPSHGDYRDDVETYFRLINHLLHNVDTLLAESCHIMFWFSMEHYESTYRLLSDVFTIDRFPLVWWKNDNSGILPDPSRGPRRVYETAFYGSRGDRKIVQAVSNTFPAPLTKGLHMSEKNPDMLRHFFRMFVDEHTLMLDPTCGSGGAIRAGATAGAAKAVGLEINEEFADHAKAALERALA